MNLQNRYELEVARDSSFGRIDREVELYPAILDRINGGNYLGNSSI
jgi:plasmid maintenance system antidote protein VapI